MLLPFRDQPDAAVHLAFGVAAPQSCMETQTSIYLAASFELGVPIVLSFLGALRPAMRKWVVVVLGALTPILLSLAVTSARHFALAQEEAGFAVWEMWLTSFLPYVACLVFGSALGLLRFPTGMSARYILGLVPPSLLAIAWAIALPQ